MNGKPIAPDVTVINEDCDIEEYLKVGRAAIVVVGHRPTLLQLIRKVGGNRESNQTYWYTEYIIIENK